MSNEFIRKYTHQRLSVAMIVKNEEVCLARCLQSVKDADEIIIVDTGSEDKTKEVVTALNLPNIKYIENEYKWNDHFGEAYTFASGKTTGDWVLVLDADNQLEDGGIDKIRKIISDADGYDAINYQIWSAGKYSHKLPRIYRKGIKWEYRVHSNPKVEKSKDSDIKIYASYSPAHKKDPDRALRMLKLQHEELPDDARTLYYLAREYWYRNDFTSAIPLFLAHTEKSRYLPEVADSFVYLARMFWKMQQGDKARTYALEAININSNFKEALLLMAEMSWKHNAKNWIRFAELASNEGVLFNRIPAGSKITCKDTKPILCFFAGYAKDFISANGGYGSEIALRKLAAQFATRYNVFAFGTSFKDVTDNNVRYMHSSQLKKFAESNIIDVMIISRYIYYYLEFPYNLAKQTYLWLHDTSPLPWWDFKVLPADGLTLLTNVIDKITGIVCLTDWHKQYNAHNLSIPRAKITTIGNGIDLADFNLRHLHKIKGRFIYCASPQRGMLDLVKNFHRFVDIIPSAHLEIYGGEEHFKKENIDPFKLLEISDRIKYRGKVTNKDMLSKMAEAEYWLHLTTFQETYCISALEAQLSGCIPITTDIAALKETVDDRGIVLNIDSNSEYLKDGDWENIVKKVAEIDNNTEKKKEYISKGINWASKQTWRNRAKEWYKLFIA